MKNVSIALAAALVGSFTGTRGGRFITTKTHRDKGYVKTVADYERIQKAEDKRTRKAVKRANDNNACIAFNPCYKRVG